jgi:hypothetical protein
VLLAALYGDRHRSPSFFAYDLSHGIGFMAVNDALGFTCKGSYKSCESVGNKALID